MGIYECRTRQINYKKKIRPRRHHEEEEMCVCEVVRREEGEKWKASLGMGGGVKEVCRAAVFWRNRAQRQFPASSLAPKKWS